MTWEFNLRKRPLKDSILIIGLPGIANVSKYAVDILIEQFRAEEICTIFSYHMPHTVYIGEDNLVEQPKISLHQHENLVFLTGDTQPIDDVSTYTLCNSVLDLFSEEIKEIVTLGGIGLDHIPKKPRLFITGNDKDIVDRYWKKGMIREIYGIVGPIVGVSGVMLGMAKKRSKKAVCILAETYGHPMYTGLNGSRKILEFFEEFFDLDIVYDELDQHIKELDTGVDLPEPGQQETTYIG